MFAISLLQIIARGQRHIMLLPSVLQMDVSGLRNLKFPAWSDKRLQIERKCLIGGI